MGGLGSFLVVLVVAPVVRAIAQSETVDAPTGRNLVEEGRYRVWDERIVNGAWIESESSIPTRCTRTLHGSWGPLARRTVVPRRWLGLPGMKLLMTVDACAIRVHR